MTEELTLDELFKRQESNRRERRYRILPVDIEVVLNLLYPICDTVLISKIKLPDDVHPVTVHYSRERQQFLFLLESDNFSPVEPGMEIPCFDHFGDLIVSRLKIVSD